MEIIWSCKQFKDLSNEELYQIFQLRMAVFVVEQNCPYQDADGKDINAWHVMGDLTPSPSPKTGEGGSSLIVLETGGMKGRREEITREELHKTLCEKFSVKKIHSEYGMTELLSQAYSKGEGIFKCPPWMKILIRDANDPFSFLPPGKTGAINIIDLANIHSCSFIATQDAGRIHKNGSFEVLGRMDNSDLRGCNLLTQ